MRPALVARSLCVIRPDTVIFVASQTRREFRLFPQTLLPCLLKEALNGLSVRQSREGKERCGEVRVGAKHCRSMP